MLTYAKQYISFGDIIEIIKVLKSETLTQGKKLIEFETKVSQKVGAKYSVATNSATSALHIACIALGLGKNDYLWTSPISFVASSNCSYYCGAEVDFVDIDPNSGLMCTKKLREKLKIAKAENKLPKILIPVHLAGTSCDMEEIFKLSKKYGFKIIEDASHAIGGKYKGNYVGSCKYSDITVFSFHPVKIITTGEGGMALTNNNDLYEHMNLLRGHGIRRKNFKETSPGPWYYEQNILGFNYRITDFQCALGINQLKKLDKFVIKRNKLVEYYHLKFEEIKEIKLLETPENVYSSYHLAIISIQNISVEGHKFLFEFMRRKGIFVQLHYWPIHLQPFYLKKGFSKGQFKNSENYSKSCFSIPLFYELTKQQQDKVIKFLKEGLYNLKKIK